MARFRFVAKYKLGQKVGFWILFFMTGGIIMGNLYEYIQLQIGDIARVVNQHRIFASKQRHNFPVSIYICLFNLNITFTTCYK